MLTGGHGTLLILVLPTPYRFSHLSTLALALSTIVLSVSSWRALSIAATPLTVSRASAIIEPTELPGELISKVANVDVGTPEDRDYRPSSLLSHL